MKCTEKEKTAKPRTRKKATPKKVSSKKKNLARQFGESVLQASPVGMVVIDNHGQVLTINSAALEAFDLNRENVTLPDDDGTPTMFFDLLPEGEISRWQYIVNMVMSTRVDYADDRFFHSTGYVEKVLAVRLSPLRSQDFGSDGLILTVEDVTNSVLMEKYLILSEKLVSKGEMASSVAHGLNEFLDAAQESVEMLGRNINDKDSGKMKENCDTISESIASIRQFVDNLIDFSKPHTEYINYDIKYLIEDLLFSLRIQPRFKQTHFTIDLSREIPNLDMDVGQIQQVLMNILNNAADTMEDKAIEFQSEGCELKKEIEIRASYDKITDSVMIEITDNGTGMTQETKDKIFDMHFSTKKSGHGLGLYNCRKIIEQHHGDIEAQSTYGEGATFRIYLPTVQPNLS